MDSGMAARDSHSPTLGESWTRRGASTPNATAQSPACHQGRPNQRRNAPRSSVMAQLIKNPYLEEGDRRGGASGRAGVCTLIGMKPPLLNKTPYSLYQDGRNDKGKAFPKCPKLCGVVRRGPAPAVFRQVRGKENGGRGTKDGNRTGERGQPGPPQFRGGGRVRRSLRVNVAYVNPWPADRLGL